MEKQKKNEITLQEIEAKLDNVAINRQRQMEEVVAIKNIGLAVAVVEEEQEEEEDNNSFVWAFHMSSYFITPVPPK